MPRLWLPRIWPAILSCSVYAMMAGSRVEAQPAGVAYLAIDFRTHATLASVRVDRLDVPVLPGSIAKIATLAAALESGVLTERAGILCTRRVVVAGRQLTCTHPDLHQPLKAIDALAQSCNVFFATVAARLPRASFDRALIDLGLPPSDARVSVAASALGIEGNRVTPRALLDMIAKVGANPSSLPWRASTLAVVREGLRGAATYGTAAALSVRGVDAMAKTGTTVTNGLAQGLVVGVWPAAAPTVGFVLVASGGAGLDAAALAAERLAHLPPARTAAGGEASHGVGSASAKIEVAVSLPSSDRNEQEAVQRFAERSLDALTDKLAVEPPSHVILRFHPTVESYERDAGQPWFTSGATRGMEVQLLPLKVLRQRGIFESTVTHELVHLLTASAFTGRPLWVVEGAAQYFTETGASEPDATRSPSPPSCPVDRAFTKPESRDALRLAYDAAEGCFAREVRAGKGWREVGR